MWDEDTCYATAQGENVDMLRYAHEYVFPFDEYTCDLAKINEHMDVLHNANKTAARGARTRVG